MIFNEQILNQIGIELFLIVDSNDGKGNVYLSNFLTAMYPSQLEKKSIKSILSVAKHCKIKNKSSMISKYLHIPIKDSQNVNIRVYFEECFTFIDESRQQTNVLVHCKAGISRSATILIAYLMNKMKLTLIQAYSHVQRINPKIKPNKGFVQQLQKYNNELGYPQTIYSCISNSFGEAQTQQQQHIAQIGQISQNQRQVIKRVKMLSQAEIKIRDHIQKINSMIQQDRGRQNTMSDYLKERIKKLKVEKCVA